MSLGGPPIVECDPGGEGERCGPFGPVRPARKARVYPRRLELPVEENGMSGVGRKDWCLTRGGGRPWGLGSLTSHETVWRAEESSSPES